MRVYIDEEERYPVYEIRDVVEPSLLFVDEEYEVSEADYQRWIKVFEEFSAVQKELEELIERR